MYMNLDKEYIQEGVTNHNYLERIDNVGKLSISNHYLYSDPNRRYQYDIYLKELSYDVYIMNGKPATGTFENFTFKEETFFDCTIFRRITFKDCHFDNIDIRWCKFEKCKFINCTGRIKYIRESTFKKDCIFENSLIKIGRIDHYMWYNSKLYNEYENTLSLQ